MQEENHYYLYKITNNVNGKLYLGVTKDFNKRMKQHINGSKDKALLSRAIKRYGKANFTFEILCIGSEEYIYDLERKAICLYGSHCKDGHGYNISLGGKGGEGNRIEKRTDDKPIFVKGFWFPNKRTATDKLNIPSTTLHQRIKSGTAGEVRWLRPSSIIDNNVYVGGFWFQNIYVAASALSVDYRKLEHRIKINAVDQVIPNPGRRKKKIYIEGEVYESLIDAVRNTQYTRKMIYRRIINSPRDFYYIE